MFAELLIIPYSYSFFGRYYSPHKKTCLACIKKYDRLKGVKWRHCWLIPKRWKTAQPGDSPFSFWHDLSSKVNPSQCSCREKEGWLLLIKWHCGKGGRCLCNWGHTVVRITGYFCQTGGQRKRQPMKSWPSERSRQNSYKAGWSPGEQPTKEFTGILGFGKSATWFLHWKWKEYMLRVKCNINVKNITRLNTQDTIFKRTLSPKWRKLLSVPAYQS